MPLTTVFYFSYVAVVFFFLFHFTIELAHYNNIISNYIICITYFRVKSPINSSTKNRSLFRRFFCEVIAMGVSMCVAPKLATASVKQSKASIDMRPREKCEMPSHTDRNASAEKTAENHIEWSLANDGKIFWAAHKFRALYSIQPLHHFFQKVFFTALLLHNDSFPSTTLSIITLFLLIVCVCLWLFYSSFISCASFIHSHFAVSAGNSGLFTVLAVHFCVEKSEKAAVHILPLLLLPMLLPLPLPFVRNSISEAKTIQSTQ